MSERGWALWMLVVFAAAFFLPWEHPRLSGAVTECVALVHWYAREHVILCVLPALLIAGAIGVFISQGAVMRYLGPSAPRPLAYAVASVSGAVLAVCSCTILPLFAGIYKRGAGLGPAVAFLFAGPAINVLAIILTARLLGWELGLARVIAAVGFAIILGLIMHFLFRRQEAQRQAENAAARAEMPPAADDGRPAGQTVALFATMIAILIAANWSANPESPGWWQAIANIKWWLSGGLGLLLALMLWRWMQLSLVNLLAVAAGTVIAAFALPAYPELAMSIALVGLGVVCWRGGGEAKEWMESTWFFTKLILPLLLLGVLIAGALLGRPDHEGLIPSPWVAAALGGEGFFANAVAACAGAFMYFATLT